MSAASLDADVTVTASQDFLIARGPDLVVLGVRLSGFRLNHDVPDPARAPRLVAMSGGEARIVVTFPPQAIAEERAPVPIFTDRSFRCEARLAGPSRLEFEVPAGTEVELNAESVLDVLNAGSGLRLLPAGSRSGSEGTAIEIPWGLIVSPRAVGSASHVELVHSARAVASPSGVLGLWHARLRGGGDTIGAGVALEPLRAEPDDPGVTPSALSAQQRQDIVRNSKTALPLASWLELSAMGGSLSARGSWLDLEWDHDAVLGRDQRVRVVGKGMLFPFGHRAEFEVVTERVFRPIGPVPEGRPSNFDPATDTRDLFDQPPPPPLGTTVAGLETTTTLFVTEPVRTASEDARLAREFPFSEVEILGRSFTGLDPPTAEADRDFFLPRLGGGGGPLLFPLCCKGLNGDVFLSMPLLFVRDSAPLGDEGFATRLAVAFGSHGTVDLPGVSIDMVRGAAQLPGDVQEVHSLTMTGLSHAGQFRPRLSEFAVEFPALRELLRGPSQRVALQFTDEFLDLGDRVDVPFKTVPGTEPLVVDFTTRADRSGGLVSPNFTADAISRALGPVAREALPDVPDLESAFKHAFRGATLLGFPLASIVRLDRLAGPPLPPKIVQLRRPGRPSAVQMKWQLPLKSEGPFKAGDSTNLTLTVESSLNKLHTMCTVSDVELVLPPGDAPLLSLRLGSVVFTQHGGHAPSLDVSNVDIRFSGDLELLKDLEREVMARIGAGGNTPTVTTSDSGVSLGYGLSLPSVKAGVFNLTNIATRIGVDVPFDGHPVAVSLAFASRENPFTLSVNAFGGGGYLDMLIEGDQLARFEASLEFGAMVAISFGDLLDAEVHALGGIRFVKADGSLRVDGFIRIGGSVDVLGLASVALELLVTLAYRKDPPEHPDPHHRLFGRATLVIEVDLTLYADSFEVDSGEFELVGSPVEETRGRRLAATADEPDTFSAWYDSRRAFAPA